MAVVRGVKEKVHLPLYDARVFKKFIDSSGTVIPSQVPIANQINGNVVRFFVDVQSKTKLETNQQESGVLSHFNTYEARALRVIVEPLKDEFSEDADDAKKRPDNPSFLRNWIYNSVTTFIVGEKIMIQAPTWTFPSGAGESNEDGRTHGWPSPEATFRFAEPVHIDGQQNFRVEVEFPDGATEALGNAQPQTKNSRVWVMLDGYLTRDVQ
jgi:hypothetical protein